MPDISDLRSTIIPKSDQLNAEQLLAGPMTITVADVRTGNDEQPVAIHYHGEEGRPFKPCKTMRKVLILAWGEDGRRWIGRSMTLFCDPTVRFGGVDVGGIRISHLSHIDRTKELSLTATRGKKAKHVIQLLETGPTLAEVLAAISKATGRDSMAEARAMAEQLVVPAEVEKAQAAYKAKASALKAASTAQAPAPVGVDVEAIRARIKACTDIEALQTISDEAEVMPHGADRTAVMTALVERDRELNP